MRVHQLVSLATLAVFFFPTYAQTLPIEQVIPASSNCLADYKNRYSPLPTHRAFAFALDHKTGKQRCGWVYGEKSAERAREVAVTQCASNPIDATCHVVDLNGKWVARAQDFTVIESPETTPATNAQKKAMLDTARPLVKGNCHPFLATYLEQEGHKSFAYSIDTAGQYACGMAVKQMTVQASVNKAIDACDRNKQKRGQRAPDAACQIYATGDNILLTASSYGLGAPPPQLPTLTDQEYRTYVDQAADVLSGSCHFAFKSYIRGKAHKAFYYAMDINGNGACGNTVGAFTEELARQNALTKCEQSSTKKNVQATCKLYAMNNDIIGKPADYKLADGIAGFKVALLKGMVSRVRDYVEQGMDIETQSDKEGATALFVAAGRGNLAAYQSFLAAGANPQHRLKDGSNLLLTAVVGGNVAIVRDALKRGIDINQKGVEGNTALHAALMKLDTYTACLLVKAGAETTIVNDKGETAETILKKFKADLSYLDKAYNATEAAKADDLVGLLDIVARLNATERREQLSNALWMMTRLSDETYAFLLENGADANHVDSSGDTVLMSAARFGKQKLIELLLAHGANKTTANKDGKRAVDFARSEKLKALLN